MADKQGYIKLFRKIVDWEWYTEVNTCKLFLHMLIMANHDTQKWRGEVIERGTFITSYASLSNETGLTIREIRTAIKHLLSTKDIEVKATSQNTRIYIVKYDFYQKNDTNSDKGKNNVISDEQEVLEDVYSSSDIPTDNQASRERQSNDTPSDKRATTNKNVKKLKNDKNEKKKTYSELVAEYTDNEDLRKVLLEFVEMRKAMKGFTLHALELKLKDLDKLAIDVSTKTDIVNQTIANSWKGFFALKTYQQRSSKKEVLPF